MRLDYLGDALDHFKGSLFRHLQRAGLLSNLSVDPMATDAERWNEDHYRLYCELLGVRAAHILKSRETLDAKGRRDLGLPGHDGDLFLDPDIGVLTGSQTPARSYVRPEEVRRLLSPSRVVAVYQHAWRAGESEAVRQAIRAVTSKGATAFATAYTSKQVAMLFFSTDSKRISGVVSSLCTWLGAKRGRIYQQNEVAQAPT
jgi:hypothetical protein